MRQRVAGKTDHHTLHKNITDMTIRPIQALVLLCCSATAGAQDTVAQAADEDTATMTTETVTIVGQPRTPDTGARTPDPFIADGAMGHFTWGVDISSGVDLTSHDMTMVDLSASFGYKGSIMRFAGIGASIITMMNNSSRCYPIYAMGRTSFSTRRKPCFMELQAGVSFNSIYNYRRTTGFYGSLGVGFTLAHSRKFSSHIVLSARYMPLAAVTTPDGNALGYTIAYASIGIGCAF